MRCVALLQARNEELYIECCIKNLIEQGFDVCLVDNESTDRTVEIAESFRNKGLFRVETIPFNGSFELKKILKFKENLARVIDADWFLHCDADEIHEPNEDFVDMRSAIEYVDRCGYNTIDFFEYVFTPVTKDENFEYLNYVDKMQHYYYYYTRRPRRVKLWKKTSALNLVSMGGHFVHIPQQHIYPLLFTMRHYIALSYDHIVQKYGERIYSQEEIDKYGWHKNRLQLQCGNIQLPQKEQLKKITKNNIFDRTNPMKKHLFKVF